MGRTPTPDPEPLLEAFQQNRAVVVDYVVRALRGSPIWRKNAAHAAAVLLRLDAELVPEFMPDLIRSVLQLDDMHSHPRAAAQKAIAAALSIAPGVVDAELKATAEKTTEGERALLFGVFDQFNRLPAPSVPDSAVEVVVRHVVEALTVPDETDRLDQAGRLLETLAGDYPEAVASMSDQLLGAAAILTESMDDPDDSAVVEVGLPPGLKAMEQANRRSSKHYAAQRVVNALAGLATDYPAQVGEPMLRLLLELPGEHGRLRAALVRGTGKVGSRREGLRLALPGLYLGLMHESTLARAAAADAYGEICRRFAEDLPDLVHECFLLALNDPYVIVHQAAVQALEKCSPPDGFCGRALASLSNLVFHYRDTGGEDRFLSKAIDVFLRIGQDILSPELAAAVVGMLSDMDPNAAWDTLRWLGRRYSGTPQYTDALLEHIADPRTYHFHLDDLSDLIRQLPPDEISRVASRICEVAPEVRHKAYGEGNPTIHLLDALRQAGEWRHAERLVEEWMADERLDDMPEARLSIEAFHAAVAVEAAVANRLSAEEVGRAIANWRGADERSSEGPGVRGIFSHVFGLRAEAIEAGVVRKGGEGEVDLVALGERITEAGARVSGVTGSRYRAFGTLVEASGLLRRWVAAERDAEVDSTRYLKAAQARVRDVSAEVQGELSPSLRNAIDAVNALEETAEVSGVCSSVFGADLPLPLEQASTFGQSGRRSYAPTPTAATSPSPVIVVAFDVEGGPLVTGAVVTPHVVHDLGITADVSSWPEGMDELVLYPASVELPNDLQLPTFRIAAPPSREAGTVKSQGRLVLNVAQSVRSQPLQFVYSGIMLGKDGREMRVSIEGQRQFEIRSYDPTTQPITGNEQVDLRLQEISGQLLRIGGLSSSDRSAFLTLLGQLGRIAGQSLSANLFDSAEWSEHDWEGWVWRDLTSRPEIGSELESHPEAGGGITDLSFHRIRLELKVERTRPVSVDDAKGYTQQTAQYVAGSQKRARILAILDVSPKTSAPGSVANSVFLEKVDDPGGGPYPIAVGVVIVRGNLARPSDLSK